MVGASVSCWVKFTSLKLNTNDMITVCFCFVESCIVLEMAEVILTSSWEEYMLPMLWYAGDGLLDGWPESCHDWREEEG